MLSSKLGLRTIDIGNPQWSMHSIRETCGTKDIDAAVNLLAEFYRSFGIVDAAMPRL
jgi:aspartyl aminopeptidase